VAIPDCFAVGRWGTFIALPGAVLITRNGVDCRITILVFLVTLAVALSSTVPDFELSPTVCRIAQRVRYLVSFAHRPNLSLLFMHSGPSVTSSFRIHNCIIELTCSRLC
jgi:hypothetical protein